MEKASKPQSGLICVLLSLCMIFDMGSGGLEGTSYRESLHRKPEWLPPASCKKLQLRYTMYCQTQPLNSIKRQDRLPRLFCMPVPVNVLMCVNPGIYEGICVCVHTHIS